jgi:hypothetical protein
MDTTVKRLTPTPDTIRRLYLLSGNQCAFPGCNHPIIVEDGTYVGELCHICAAEKGGERFDPTQTNEDRRQFDNLLLLCHDHHVVTNDVVAYTIERMRQMKADHERRFELGLASMMESTGIQITNSTISLGGEGGKSPGAGGGGGGAIGSGAIGGTGGAGGEINHGVFRIDNDVVEMRVHVGNGGQGGIDGNGGGNGEDTFVEAVRQDGSVQEILRAKGGKGGEYVTGSARVSIALLANHAELREGLLFALGAGWRSYDVELLPTLLIFNVLYIAEPDSMPHGTITTNVVDSHDVVVATHTQLFDFSGGNVPFIVKVFAPATEVGMWHVVLSCGERELWRLPFEVQLQ